MLKGRLAGILLGLALFSLPLNTAQAAVSVHAVDCEVRDVIFGLALQSGDSVLLDDSVSGRITLQLDEVEFSAALDMIASVKGLQYYKKNDNVYLISEKLPDVAAAHIIAVDNMTAQQALANSRALLGLTEDEAKDRLAFTEAPGRIIYYGSQAAAKRLEQQLGELDVRPSQVVLEAKIIAVENSAAEKLGIEWEWSKFPQTPERETSETTRHVSVWNDSAGEYENIYETVPVEKITRHYNNGIIPGIIKLGHGYEAYYAAKLDALIGRGKAEMLARPNVMALDGREAQINIGGSVPVPTVTNTNIATTTSLEYHDVGVILKYTPRLSEDGAMTADVHMEVSSPVYVEGMQAYKFNKRSVDTAVRLADGETLVIGGLIGHEESENISRVPFLSDIPILGKFFQHKDESRSDSEIVIFLTANIVT